MSRCFPFTPPKYKKEDVSLIGSIKKLQNERGNTKQRKEMGFCTTNKKRPRDEHTKLNSLEHKDKKRRNDEHDKLYPLDHKDKKSRNDGTKTKLNKSCYDSGKDDSEHLERSDLSEEHSPPIFVLNRCSSLQSALNSSKKNDIQEPDPNRRRPGLVIRIKLPSKKHNDLKPVSTSTNPYSSQVTDSSKIQPVFTDSFLQQKETPVAKQLLSVSEEPCFSGRISTVPTVPTVPIVEPKDCIVEAHPSKSSHKRSRHESSIHKSERRFRELIVNWKPPSLQLNNPEEEDLDWLFASRGQPKDGKSSAQISKASISEPIICPIPTNSLQPRACYLPEYDMYQLPYVIPF